jgi:hypothetical protein
MIAEYLEHAIQFERLAAEEQDAGVKKQFEKQAAAYRQLAAKRTKELGLDDPDKSSI